MDLEQLKTQKVMPSVKTDWDCFSELLSDGNIPVGSLIRIKGSPGCGKTTYALQLADNIQASNPDLRVHFVSLEMDPAPLKRMLDRLEIKHLNSFLFEHKHYVAALAPGSVFIIDSLDALARTLGMDFPTQDLAIDFETKKKEGTTFVVIHHNTKSGTSNTGANAFRQIDDILINMTADGTGTVAISTTQKNRNPGTTQEILANLTDGGFVPKQDIFTMLSEQVQPLIANAFKKVKSFFA